MSRAMVRDDSPPDDLARRLSAISFGERRALLEQLLHAHVRGDTGMTITALATATGTNRFTASRQLGVLRESGLVRESREGTRRIHRIDLSGVVAIDDWLYPFIDAHLAATDAG